MSSTPTVSVVMPVYNTAGYVADTIDSILAQTFTDFELLILDDGSTDGTPAVLKRYADRDPRVKVVTRENKGIIDSRNELLALARGRYMAANDADDLSVPDRLAVQVAYMDAHPEVVLLGSRVVEMDPYGSPVFVTGQPLTHEEIEKQLLDNRGGWAIVQSSMICRTDAARQVGGYDRSLGNPCFSEDHDFFVRLAEVGRVANLERPLAWYRRHYSSTTRTYYLKKLEQHRRMKEQVLRGAHERRGLTFPKDWKFSPIVAPPRDEQARRWGWAALKHGNVAVARRHAAEAVRRAPWKPASLRLWLAARRRDLNEKGQTFPLAYSNVGTPAAGSTDTKTMDANPTSGNPTVSVLMSVYNGGRYLRPCLDSLLAQTLRDVEFVIVDDGSKDGSPDVLREYAARDARIKLTVRSNKGLTKTLNECFAQARGEFLARMDCDDVCYPDRFERQVAFLRANPDVVCVGSYFDLIDEEGRKLTTLRPPADDAEIQRQVLKGHTAICHPSAMIRASALRQIGGYCEDFKTAQDIDLWLRLGEVGKLANLPTPVLRFRLHETSVSETKRYEQRQSSRTACERAWKRRGIEGVYEADEPWRPGKDSASRHKFALQYGWWAFNAGEKATARHYAWRAIKAVPMKAEGWKLLAAATLKPAKRQSAA